MSYYPVGLDIKGKRCLVIGGGQIAYRKVSTLLSYHALVELVAPELVSSLQELAQQGVISHRKEEYRPFMLDGAFLVFGATSSQKINRTIARDAHERNIPVNIIDAPDLCTFLVPAVLRRGDLTISVSTSGKSPALARSLRENMEKEFGAEWENFTRFLGEVRKYLLQQCSDPTRRRKILQYLGQAENVHYYTKGQGNFFENSVWSYLKEKKPPDNNIIAQIKKHIWGKPT